MTGITDRARRRASRGIAAVSALGCRHRRADVTCAPDRSAEEAPALAASLARLGPPGRRATA